MTNYGKISSDKLTNWLIYEAGFNQYKFQMSLYYNYAPDVPKLVVISYVDYCVYWYTSEELVVCGYTWKYITCEPPMICTLVYAH